jgi:uncharacterized protein (DUF2252 family)
MTPAATAADAVAMIVALGTNYTAAAVSAGKQAMYLDTSTRGIGDCALRELHTFCQREWSNTRIALASNDVLMLSSQEDTRAQLSLLNVSS